MERLLDPRNGRLPAIARQLLQSLPLAREAAIDLGAEQQKEPPRFEQYFPTADPGFFVGPDPQRFGRRHQRLEDSDAVRAAEADASQRFPLAEPQARPAGGSKRRPPRRIDPRQHSQELPCLARRDFDLQRQGRLIELHLAEALDPSQRQLHFLFDDALLAAFQLYAIAADSQSRHVPFAQTRQRRPQGAVEVDVCRPVPLLLGIKPLGRQVDAGIDTATAAEPLEPQHRIAAGDHRIAVRRPMQEEV